jgi:hypothetical protein
MRLAALEEDGEARQGFFRDDYVIMQSIEFDDYFIVTYYMIIWHDRFLEK